MNLPCPNGKSTSVFRDDLAIHTGSICNSQGFVLTPKVTMFTKPWRSLCATVHQTKPTTSSFHNEVQGAWIGWPHVHSHNHEDMKEQQHRFPGFSAHEKCCMTKRTKQNLFWRKQWCTLVNLEVLILIKQLLINSEHVILSEGKTKCFFRKKLLFFFNFCFHYNSMLCFLTALKVASLDSTPQN